jgi:hypothetical protein
MNAPANGASPLLDRVENLILAGERGELTDTAMQELDQLIRDNPEARRFYAMYYVETTDLRAWAACAESDGSFLTYSDAVGSGNSSREAVMPQPLTTHAVSFPSSILGHTVSYFSYGWPAAYLVAAAILGIGMVFGALTHVSRPQQFAQQPSTVGRMPIEHIAKSVGRITGIVDCIWAGRSRVSRDVMLGTIYSLESGWLEITYDTGAKVILQGPMIYKVKSDNGGYLSVGKLTGKVETDAAKGFAIHTPTATVTDLGTEFSVEVNPENETKVIVVRGKVNMVAVGRDSHIEKGQIIGAGHTGRVYANATYDVVVNASSAADEREIVRVMPQPNRNSPADLYTRLVLSMKPVAYFPMEVAENQEHRQIVRNLASGGMDGIFNCDPSLQSSLHAVGRFGNAIYFLGPMAQSHVIVPDYPKATNDCLTVSAWITRGLRTEHHAVIAANWGSGPVVKGHEEAPGQFHFGVPGDNDSLWARVTQRDHQWVDVHETASQPVPSGVWQHVAFVADGQTLRLYRGGKQVASVPCNSVLPTPPVACLSIGCTASTSGTEASPSNACYWCGRIDELAIFNRALSGEEIKMLYTGPKD